MKRKAKALLVAALVVVVGMAFRVSWNALRDVARAIGADPTAATLYPFVVDGLMALALVATLALTGDTRRLALKVLATYTVASLVLNYVHGLVPALHGSTVDVGRLAGWDPANWALVLLATSLPVGSIYFGSDLVAKVLHHQPATIANDEESAEVTVKRSTPDLEERPSEPVPAIEVPAPVTEPDPVPAVAPVEPTIPLPGEPAEPAIEVVPVPPRRSTGRVPAAARAPRPIRTPEQLLAEARSATADWSDAELTAEGIRKAVRTSPAKARVLRDTLRAERSTEADDEPDALAA